MKNERFGIETVFFAFLIFTFACVLSASAQSNLPQPGAPRAAKIPTPVERTLKNGLRVIVVETKNVPLVTAELVIKSGGEVDPENLAGAADMTAKLLTKGTKTRAAIDIAEQIEFLGGSLDSGAGWDESSATVRVMSDKLDKALAIAADAVRNPTFAQEEIDRHKTQLLDELSVNLKQPGALASYVAGKVIFGGGIYGHLLVGTPESINRIRRTDLVKLHHTYYKPNNSILIFAGDIAPVRAFALAEKHFGTWAKGAAPSTQNLAQAGNGGMSDRVNLNKITVVDLPGAGQAAVSIAKAGIERKNPFFYQLTVANSVLGGGYSARLNQEIRIKRGLSYGAGSNLSTRREAGLFTARAQTKNESAAEVAEIIIAELNRLASEPVANAELNPRKLVLIGDFSRDLETTNGLVERIGELALYDLPLDQINSFIQNVQAIDSNQVQYNIKRFYGANAAHIVIVGDAKQFLPDLAKRFPAAKIEVIPADELDLNRADLRKVKTPNATR